MTGGQRAFSVDFGGKSPARQLVDELANALQSAVLIAERLEQQATSVSLDASDVMKGLRRATTVLSAVRAADHGSE